MTASRFGIIVPMVTYYSGLPPWCCSPNGSSCLGTWRDRFGGFTSEHQPVAKSSLEVPGLDLRLGAGRVPGLLGRPHLGALRVAGAGPRPLPGAAGAERGAVGGGDEGGGVEAISVGVGGCGLGGFGGLGGLGELGGVWVGWVGWVGLGELGGVSVGQVGVG